MLKDFLLLIKSHTILHWQQEPSDSNCSHTPPCSLAALKLCRRDGSRAWIPQQCSSAMWPWWSDQHPSTCNSPSSAYAAPAIFPASCSCCSYCSCRTCRSSTSSCQPPSWLRPGQPTTTVQPTTIGGGAEPSSRSSEKPASVSMGAP